MLRESLLAPPLHQPLSCLRFALAYALIGIARCSGLNARSSSQRHSTHQAACHCFQAVFGHIVGRERKTAAACVSERDCQYFEFHCIDDDDVRLVFDTQCRRCFAVMVCDEVAIRSIQHSRQTRETSFVILSSILHPDVFEICEFNANILTTARASKWITINLDCIEQIVRRHSSNGRGVEELERAPNHGTVVVLVECRLTNSCICSPTQVWMRLVDVF
jgi:hypothetical protein